MEAAARKAEDARPESGPEPESETGRPEPEPSAAAPEPEPGRSSGRDARGRYPGSRVSRTNLGLLNGQTDWEDYRLRGFRIGLRVRLARTDGA